MARIRVTRGASALRVAVIGRLSATDMRRLEHACAPALTSEQVDLVVDLKRVTHIDPVAAAHLQHIASRGAVIKRPVSRV